MTSIERIIEYTLLPVEPLHNGDVEPASEWPRDATITFQDVSFSYAPNLPAVLKNISFEIKSGEKIGVVGRTGAGKSSIIQALFRFGELDGDILIDNVNIKEISLNSLRTKLSIIPVI